MAESEIVRKVADSLHCPDWGREEATSPWRRLPFEILFDSLSQSPLPGTRSIHKPAHRHLVLEAEKYTVDVRLEREPPPGYTVRPGGSRGAVVVGQIQHRQGGGPIPRTPVFIFSGDKIVRQSLVSPSGEFHIEGLPDFPLSLCLLVGREEVIEIPLRLD